MNLEIKKIIADAEKQKKGTGCIHLSDEDFAKLIDYSLLLNHKIKKQTNNFKCSTPPSTSSLNKINKYEIPFGVGACIGLLIGMVKSITIDGVNWMAPNLDVSTHFLNNAENTALITELNNLTGTNGINELNNFFQIASNTSNYASEFSQFSQVLDGAKAEALNILATNLIGFTVGTALLFTFLASPAPAKIINKSKDVYNNYFLHKMSGLSDKRAQIDAIIDEAQNKSTKLNPISTNCTPSCIDSLEDNNNVEKDINQDEAPILR